MEKNKEIKGRIGVMTWFSYRNYGTVLQALALQVVLRKLGYEGKVIDYDPRLGVKTHEPAAERTFLRKVHDRVRRNLGYQPVVTDERESAFDSFIFENIPLTSPVASEEDFQRLSRDFDCFVCGSDQVWSPRCFDKRYFLDFAHDSCHRVAYATSFGCDCLDGFTHSGDIARLLQGFSAIGAREMSGVDIVEKCIGSRPAVVLDPTLLLSDGEWAGYAQPIEAQEHYCLLYFLGENAANRKAAHNIARKRGLRIVDIPVFQRDLQRDGAPTFGVGPGEFLALLCGADMVCTDSFHGMAFASIFSKPLVAFERFDPNGRDSQNTRIYSFLDIVGLRGALLTRANISNWEAHLDSCTDYEEVHKRIHIAQDRSLDFLAHALSNSIAMRQKECC